MNRFLKYPQLPETTVSLLAIGQTYVAGYAAKLEQHGIEVLALQGPTDIDPRLRGHADLLLLHRGGDNFLAAEGLKEHNSVPIKNYVNLLNNEAALNVCVLGQYWIGCPDRAAWCPDDRRQIAVKQRYARCSVCIVDAQSIITADHGIARAAAACGVDVLEISPGHICLDGFNYGFIGGASFKLAADKLAFTGSLRHHPDEKRILGFLEDRKIQPVYLSDCPLQDIGSAVLIREKA